MIPFIFFVGILQLIFMYLFYRLNSPIMLILNSFGMMVIGFYIYTKGIDNMNNLMTTMLGNIMLFLGAYILLSFTLDMIDENFEVTQW